MKQSIDLASLIKIDLPWASGAGAAYVREVPDQSQITVTPGAASWNDGFVPLNMTAKASGGIPPAGQDTNGVLRRLSQWVRYITAAGVIPYDATFQNTVGGYPLGSVVATSYTGAAGTTGTLGRMWVSVVDGNTTNPDTGGAGWLYIPLPADVLALIATNVGPVISTIGSAPRHVLYFTSSGTWTAPAGITSAYGRATGGGGGGGGGSTHGGGGGGSGGAYVEGPFAPVPGTTYTITVGLGGGGGLGNTSNQAYNGANGGPSSIGAFMTAGGGLGGGGGADGVAGVAQTGGTATGGGVQMTGGSSGSGGSTGSTGTGTGGSGGNSPMGGSITTTTGGGANAGNFPGGGGGGGAGGNYGAAGAPGYVVIMW